MLNNIQDCTTWQCLNSFALWLSAFGTILVSSVSLYVSYKAYSYAKTKDIPKIKATVTTGIIGDPVEPLDFLGLEVVNSGHRKVILTGYSWEFKESLRTGKQLISHVSQNKQSLLSNKIPCELEEGRKATFFNPIDLFIRTEEFHKGVSRLGVWYRIYTLKIRVACTTFEKTIKVPRGIRRLIWHQYKSEMKSS